MAMSLQQRDDLAGKVRFLGDITWELADPLTLDEHACVTELKRISEALHDLGARLRANRL